MAWTSFLSDSAIIFQPMGKTIVFALWYSALFWLPVRFAAAVIHHQMERRKAGEDEPEPTPEACTYHLGMRVLPPL